MSFVGMDIDKRSQLKTHLDQAAADLNAHADRVAALLAQAGIGSSQAPAEIRDVAAWAAYRSRDLQRRIDRMIAANGGSGPGFRFASPTISRSAAKKEADTLKTLMQGGDAGGVAEALAKVKAYAGDPVFGAALLHALGTGRLLQMLRGTVDADSTGIELPPATLTTVAALLASVARANPDDKVVKGVLDKASPAELVALLKIGGFGSDFVGRAAVTILEYSPYTVGPLDKKLADARRFAIDALKADPAAVGVFFKHADDLTYMSLLRDPDPSHVALVSAASLDRLLELVAHDDEISAAAKQELAKLLVPAFLDGRITNTEVDQDPKLALLVDPTHNELRDALAALMTDEHARKTIFDATAIVLAKHVAQAVPEMLANLHDPSVTNVEPDAYEGGQLIRVVQQAYAQMLGDDAQNEQARAELLKTAGHLLGELILQGAPIGVGAAANYVVDHVVDGDATAALQRLAAADVTGPAGDSALQIKVAVAEVLARDETYRKSLEAAGLFKKGRLVDIKDPSPQKTLLNDWYASDRDLNKNVLNLISAFGGWEKEQV